MEDVCFAVIVVYKRFFEDGADKPGSLRDDPEPQRTKHKKKGAKKLPFIWI